MHISMRCIRFSLGIVHSLKILCNCPSSPPTTLCQPFTTLSNLRASFTSLHIWPLCRVILRPRNFCHPRLERFCWGGGHFWCWGQVGAQPSNLSQPSTTHLFMHCIRFSFCVRAMFTLSGAGAKLGPNHQPLPPRHNLPLQWCPTTSGAHLNPTQL